MKKLTVLIWLALAATAAPGRCAEQEATDSNVQGLSDWADKPTPYATRNYCYLASSRYTEKRNDWHAGFWPIAALCFGAVSHACRNLPVNNHVYALGCGLAAVAMPLLAGLTEPTESVVPTVGKYLSSAGNFILRRPVPEQPLHLQKLRARTLLDGYVIVPLLAHLEPGQVTVLKDAYLQARWRQHEEKWQQNAEPGLYTLLIHGQSPEYLRAYDAGCNLLHLATNAHGRLEIPADIEMQKRAEDAVRNDVQAISREHLGQPVHAQLKAAFDETDRYAQKNRILNDRVRNTINGILTPLSAVAGYVGAYANLGTVLSHHGLFMGSCAASALAAGIASFNLVNTLYKSYVHLPSKTEHATAERAVRNASTPECEQLKSVWRFCERYGYLPGIKRDYRDAADYRTEAKLALALIEGAEATAN